MPVHFPYSIINNAAKQSDKIFHISGAALQELERIAEGYSQTSFKARSLLQLITGRAYRMPFPDLPAGYGLSAENWHTYFKQDDIVDQMADVSIRHLINEDELHIYLSSADHSKYEMRVVSIHGQVMSANSYTNYDGHFSTSLSHLPAGIFLIILYKDQQPIYTSKIIRQ